MNILLIDDDNEKSEQINKVLRESKVLEDINIDTGYNIFEAKQKLQNQYYDLMILDLNLPYDYEEECKEDAGYLLFKEIIKLNILKKPGHIVIMTSFENLHIKYRDEVEKGLFSIIKYSAFEDEWKKKIETKINYIIASKRDYVKTAVDDYNYDMAIITAVKVEHEQMIQLITEKETISFPNDPTPYISGYFENNNKRIRVVTATQHQMGMAASSVLTMKIIKNFRPKYVCMVGIAAGRKGAGNLGDIVFATEVWDFTSGKIGTSIKNDSKKEEFLFMPDPKYIDVEVTIKELFSKDYSSILNKIYNDWKAPKPDTVLKIVKGPMACGSIVVQNEELVKKYIDPHNRKLAGIDMESYGVLYASRNSYEPRPKTFICKSICDFADSNKNDDYQAYSAYTSAKFLFYFTLSELF